MKFEHIIFDFDGTIVDSAPCILKSYQEVFKESGITPAVPINSSIIGPPLPETISLLAATTEQAIITTMAEKFKACYDRRVATETPIYKDIDYVLSVLMQRGHKLYIATNKRYIPTIAIIEHLGMSKYFEVIGAVDQMQPGQQKKSLLIQSLMMNDAIAANQTLYIGDKLDDFLAAAFNAVPFAAAGWGYGEWAEPYTILNTPKDILSLVEGEHA